MAQDCEHGMSEEYCATCRARARGLPRWVHITGAGQVFHLRRDCQALQDGWAKARRFGEDNTPLRRVEIVDALARGLGGCEDCCGHLDLQPPQTT